MQPTEAKGKLEGAIAGDDNLVIRTEACWRRWEVWSSSWLGYTLGTQRCPSTKQ